MMLFYVPIITVSLSISENKFSPTHTIACAARTGFFSSASFCKFHNFFGHEQANA
jgi:hypothetical protein